MNETNEANANIDGAVSKTPDTQAVDMQVPVTPEVPVTSVSVFHRVHQYTAVIQNHRFVVLAVVLLVCVLGGLTVYENNRTQVPVKQFTNVYSFVPEKISKSASIRVSLPAGVDEATAQAGISFSPELKGAWITEEESGVIIFDPIEELREGTYYAVNMDAGVTQMSGDFYVDADPEIESIFPVAGTETHEDSEITIVFNRPMVPLTTLEVQEGKNIPITIAPETKGHFKWISTRNLQFIPETTLIPASQYVVTIGEGLTSLDGLAVAPRLHTFSTRPLRYEFFQELQIGYTSPMVVTFNQSVNLEETAKKITVQKDEGTKVPVVVEYGKTTHFDTNSRKMVTETDTRKIFIYQKEDTHGRKKIWDFNTTYALSFDGAVPLQGSVHLEEKRTAQVMVPSIVQNIEVKSARNPYGMTTLFDPQGTIVLTFYDDIDTDRSAIEAKGLRTVAYGERCQMDELGEAVMRGNSCVMERDMRTVILSFDADAFAVGESFTLNLKTLYSPDGFRITTEPISLDFRVYQPLVVSRTIPTQGETNAALDGMYICSNAPLQDPKDAGLSSYIRTDGYIVYGRWSDSFYVPEVTYNSDYYKCAAGEFQTQLHYGLLPKTNYTMTVALTDVFGQKNETLRTFTTSEAKEQYTRFHNMQKQYHVTQPNRTKFTYAVENLEYVDLHICKMSPEAFLTRTDAGEESTAPARTDDCTEVQTKRIELPHRYWVNNYFQVDLHDYFTETRGSYVLTFSNPLYTDSYTHNQLYDRTYVSVTNLAVGKKEVEYADYTSAWGSGSNPAHNGVLNKKIAASNNLYWINYSDSLTPVSGATVTQFSKKSDSETYTVQSTGTTDTEGIAQVHADQNLIGAVIRHGSDVAVVGDWADTLGYAGAVYDASRTYMYTDRPIYRPGHTVNIRGIDRVGFDGSYEVWKEDTVPLSIYDSLGTKLYETKLAMSTYGTFSTQFELPNDAPLGTYRIEVYDQSAWFDVEEYVPAAFKLEATIDKEEYMNGDVMKLDVQADYYFGVPLSEGTVTYSVTAQDYHFDRYTNEYFNFGGGWYTCYWCGYGDSFLFRGQARIDENGRAKIERSISLNDYFDATEKVGSKLVTVSLTAKDINGRSVSTQKSFIMHAGEYYVGVVTDEYYTGVQAPVQVRIKTVDTQGKPLSLSNVVRTVNKIDWETFKRQEVDGGFYYRSEKRVTEISQEKIKTDGDGNWSGVLTFPKEGQYEIRVAREDSRGNNIETSTYVYIYGDASVSVPPNNNYELDLEVQQSNVSVGDTASLLIKSPYEYAKVLITAERGAVYDYWVTEIRGGLAVHEFNVTSEYVPNVTLSALLLSKDPEVKFGSTEFQVDRDQYVLDVEVTSDKKTYLPGENVTLAVVTKDSNGQPLQAEVSLAVADLSVLALKGNPKKDPLQFFYDGFPLYVSTASNIKNILYEVSVPLGTKGGGGNPDDLAAKKRGLFKDTAFWSASVETGNDGKATIRFTLPDNLTTWQVESVGITRDTKVGVDYAEFSTKKELMAIPLKPRFVVPGDTFKLGAQIFNQSDTNAEVVVRLSSNTLTLAEDAEDTISIRAGETKTVYFDVEAPKTMREGAHMFTVTASYGSMIDIVEQTIPITPNTTYETVATANMTNDTRASEYLYIPPEVVSGEGGLTINTNATLAVFMLDAITYMATYPYGCSEQLASALSTIGTLTNALTIPNVKGDFDTIMYQGTEYTVDDVVKEGLAKIYKTQSIDGGFAYYPDMRANLSLSIHVLNALSNLKKAGFEVRDDVLARAVLYIETTTRSEYAKDPARNREFVIWAEYVLRGANGDQDTELTDTIEDLIDTNGFLAEEVSSMSLGYLAIMTAQNFGIFDKQKVYDALQNRIDIDGRGAYLKPYGTMQYAYYETSVKDTALLLRAFVAHEDTHVATGNVLRWLLASRDSNGVWGSTHNTFVVIDAMTAYLAWKHETEATFDLKASLDGESLFTHSFNRDNIFQTFTKYIPIDDLVREKILPLTFDRTDTNNTANTLYYDMSLKYFLPVASLPLRDEGITISRSLYSLLDTEDSTPLTRAKVGDIVRGKITVVIPDQYAHVAIEDMIPAGFEIVNFNLNTEDSTLNTEDNTYEGGYGMAPVEEEEGIAARVTGFVRSFFGESQTAQVYDSWGSPYTYQETHTRKLRPSHIESHDDRVFLYVESLAPGIYEYEYYLRALVPGTFQYLPARAEEMYFPEVFGRTSGDIFTVTED